MKLPNNKILLVAGEASGDLWGSLLVRELHALNGDLQFFGVGLKKMEAEGVSLLISPEEMSQFSLVGGLENLGRFPALVRLRRKIFEKAQEESPRAAILIDYPGFNLQLAKKLKNLKIPLIYYPPPQVWLWGRWRLKKLRKYFKKLLVFFPFEETFYQRSGLETEWVGHPICNWLEDSVFQKAESNGGPLNPSNDLIGLLPGSRLNTIRLNLPPMLAAARILHSANPDRRFLIPLAPMIPREFVTEYLGETQNYVKVIEGEAGRVLRSCGTAMVVSGTGAFEAALCETPFVLCGKFSKSLSFGVRVLRIHPEGIVNRLAKKRLVPELWQHEVTGVRLAQEIEGLLGDRPRFEEIVSGLRKVRETFTKKGNASLHAAKAVKSILNGFTDRPNLD